MTTELHVAWVYDCEECGKENFLRAVTGDAHEIMRLLTEGEPVVMLVAEEEHVEQVGPELHEAPSVISELAIAPMYVTCQHCGHKAPAEPCKIDEERL